jgi:hypothetical protein
VFDILPFDFAQGHEPVEWRFAVFRPLREPATTQQRMTRSPMARG